MCLARRAAADDPAAKKAARAFPADRRHRFSWGRQNQSLERFAARSGARRYFGHRQRIRRNRPRSSPRRAPGRRHAGDDIGLFVLLDPRRSHCGLGRYFTPARQWPYRAISRVIIETTGLADPAPVLHTVMAHPYLMLRFRVDGVVTLVDTVNGNATLDAHEEAVKQAAMADRLVLSKTDLLTAAAVPCRIPRAPDKTQSGRDFARRRERRSHGRGASRCRDLRSGSKNSRCAALVERGGFCGARSG